MSASRSGSLRRPATARRLMAASGENPRKDYVVGGGQFRLESPGRNISCRGVNFGLSAHIDEDAPSRTVGVGGSLTLTVPNNNSDCEPGHLVAKVDCVAVNEGSVAATLTAQVTKVSGSLAPAFPLGSRIAATAAEEGASSPDDRFGVDQARVPCNASPTTPIERGNIRIDGNQG